MYSLHPNQDPKVDLLLLRQDPKADLLLLRQDLKASMLLEGRVLKSLQSRDLVPNLIQKLKNWNACRR
jgi:hypothetical protein